MVDSWLVRQLCQLVGAGTPNPYNNSRQIPAYLYHGWLTPGWSDNSASWGRGQFIADSNGSSPTWRWKTNHWPLKRKPLSRLTGHPCQPRKTTPIADSTSSLPIQEHKTNSWPLTLAHEVDVWIKTNGTALPAEEGQLMHTALALRYTRTQDRGEATDLCPWSACQNRGWWDSPASWRRQAHSWQH